MYGFDPVLLHTAFVTFDIAGGLLCGRFKSDVAAILESQSLYVNGL